MTPHITIRINERVSGDVEVHIHQPPCYSTTREGRYADAITSSIKAHLAKQMPDIVKAVLKAEEKGGR